MTLEQWLLHLEKLHPANIELGLERIRRVADNLALDFSDKTVITVAGTNGKGSTVATLSAILQAAGYRTATYTSPHLKVYNERVTINGSLATDEALCHSFQLVEEAREDIALTYFEFGTLAALALFRELELDYVMLEVGLGGRLDAVNLIDPDLSILTNVALDHMDWLGDDRDSIGFEKAGIFRAKKPALYGETDMPASVAGHAAAIGAGLMQQGRDFGWERAQAGQWHWFGRSADGNALHYRDLPPTFFNLDNMATVLQALYLLLPDLKQETVGKGLEQARVDGRFQLLAGREGQPDTLLDVAHNAHAAANLLSNLERHFQGRELRIVIAMLSDKDSGAVVELMSRLPARWYVGQIHDERGSDPKILYNLLLDRGVTDADCFTSVLDAYRAACTGAGPETLVLVTGSFFTVADVLEYVGMRLH